LASEREALTQMKRNHQTKIPSDDESMNEGIQYQGHLHPWTSSLGYVPLLGREKNQLPPLACPQYNGVD
jgi:hypothetical protein